MLRKLASDPLYNHHFIFFFFDVGSQVANVNPKLVCDFDPCQEAGCLYNPEARCITDFECNPVFFNTDGKMLPHCKGKNTGAPIFLVPSEDHRKPVGVRRWLSY